MDTKILELNVNPDDIYRGGIRLWKIQTRERLFNGRFKLLGFTLTILVISFYFSAWSLLLLLALPLLFVYDYFADLRDYKELALHNKTELDPSTPLYIRTSERGYFHFDSTLSQQLFANYWSAFNYVIDDSKHGFLFLIDKDSQTIIFHKSWMSSSDFDYFRLKVCEKIGRVLDKKFL